MYSDFSQPSAPAIPDAEGTGTFQRRHYRQQSKNNRRLHHRNQKISEKWLRLCLRQLRQAGPPFGQKLKRSLSLLPVFPASGCEPRRPGLRLRRHHGAPACRARPPERLYSHLPVPEMRLYPPEQGRLRRGNPAGWPAKTDFPDGQWKKFLDSVHDLRSDALHTVSHFRPEDKTPVRPSVFLFFVI